jgi:hypothetical protein
VQKCKSQNERKDIMTDGRTSILPFRFKHSREQVKLKKEITQLLSISVQSKALKPGKAIYPQISQMDADEKTHNSGLV